MARVWAVADVVQRDEFGAAGPREGLAAVGRDQVIQVALGDQEPAIQLLQELVYALKLEAG